MKPMKTMRISYLFFVVFFLLSVVSCKQNKISADLIIYNANIITMDSLYNGVTAIATKSDTILAVGKSNDILKLADKGTQLIDLEGKTLIPGFIESHGHFMEMGSSKIVLDLTHVRSWAELVQIVGDAAKKEKLGTWILGRGWHQEKFVPTPEPNVNGYPVHTLLSELTPDNPVLLKHATGHAIFVNEKAMELAGITKNTPDPSGGRIIHDSTGQPIGVFEENAASLIYRIYSDELNKMTKEEKDQLEEKQALLAQEECLSNGVTSFSDASASNFEGVNFLKKMVDQGKLNIRLYSMLGVGNDELLDSISKYRMIGYGNNHLTLRTIKRFMDGAVGSRGAWLFEPYSDLPSSCGGNVIPVSMLEETAEIAISNDFQLCTHAIGDKANREVLDVYERTFAAHPEKKDLRWRIEHAQHLSVQDIPRFAELGVIASMQTVHAIYDGSFIDKRLGSTRAEEGAYVCRKLLDSGAIICNGTDVPVVGIDPILNFYAAVTRKMEDGTTFYPKQVMTRMEALKSQTIDGAYASFEEDIKGSLTPGKLADMTVLSNDILTIPEDSIMQAKVLMTIVGGKVVWESK